MTLSEIQTLIRNEKAGGWVLVDYENHNPVLKALFGEKMLTRKIFVIIPPKGKGTIVCHSIDAFYLNDSKLNKDFALLIYKTWQEMQTFVKKTMKGFTNVLMDISEAGLLPRVALADYGSVEFIRKCHVAIRSSCNVLQALTAVLTKKGYELQKKGCKIALQIKDEAFRKIRNDVVHKGEANEYDIQQFIAKRFKEEGMVFDEPAIVAIGPNASNPHYAPTKEKHSSISKGDLVLIDMWAKIDDPEAGWADITWMGYVGNKVPANFEERFAIVKKARDGVIEFLKKKVASGGVCGFEADDVARKIITEAGYGKHFVHRTGHSIANDGSPHGPGANLDNLESHDERRLINGTSFSDEPGIYAPDFGVRSETDLHIEGKKLVVIGGLQDKIIPILALK